MASPRQRALQLILCSPPMSTSISLHSLTLSGVARHCAEESDHFFHRRAHDPRFCFELFRRAIEERDEHAWSLLCDQYRPLVAGWVKRNEAFASSKENVSYFVNGAFAKMWSAVSAEKFADFDDLKSLLRYLQLCVASVIMDHVRAVEYHERLEDLPPNVEEATGVHVEQRALEQADRKSFWEAINARLNDEQEKLVVYYSYVVGFKPSQILEHRPDAFADVRDIYRTKENVLARLRRDEALKELFSSDA